MPKQTAKTGGLAAKYADKGRKAVAEHRTDETKYSTGGNLPSGIEDGLAQLTKCYFAQYEQGDGLKGEYYFRAEGTILEPKTFTDAKGNTHRLQGKMTSIMEPLCDTPTRSRPTTADHVAWVLNEMRKLGLPTKDLTFDDLETAAAQLQEAAPLFSFRTWDGGKDEIVQQNGQWYVQKNGKTTAGPFRNEAALKAAKPYAGKEPMVNQVWNGVVSDQTVPDESSNAVQDDTASSSAPTTNDEQQGTGPLVSETDDLDILAELADGNSDQAEDAAKKIVELGNAANLSDDVLENTENWTAAAELVKKAIAKPAGKKPAASGGDDLTALGEAADNADSAAIKKLTALAKAKDIDPDTIETWAEVATLLAEASGGGDAFVPKVKEMYLYKPKGAKKAVEHEVTAVFDAKQTANLKNINTGESLKGVAWADFDPNM